MADWLDFIRESRHHALKTKEYHEHLWIIWCFGLLILWEESVISLIVPVCRNTSRDSFSRDPKGKRLPGRP